MLIRLLLAIILFGSINSYANENERTVENVATHDTLQKYSTIGASSTTTVLTDSVSLENTGLATNIGVMYKATSSGVVGVSIQAQRSFQRPTTEGSSDATYVVWNTAFTTTDTAWHLATLDTVVTPYLNFKVTGTGSNDASTTVQIKVEKL